MCTQLVINKTNFPLTCEGMVSTKVFICASTEFYSCNAVTGNSDRKIIEFKIHGNIEI